MQLADEERISFGFAVDGSGQLVAWKRVRGELDHPPDLGHIKPPEANRARNRLATHLRHGLGQLVGSRLGISIGADDDNAGLA